MAEAHQIVLATAAIVATNEAILAPLAGHGTPWKDFNWRLLPATAVVTLAFVGLEKVAPPVAKGLAVVLLVTVLVTPLSHGVPPPLVSAADIFVGNAPSQGTNPPVPNQATGG